MKLPLESIAAFIAASEQGSFSAAARHLKKTQAAISLTIQNIEVEVGYDLFCRQGKRPVLTERGEFLLQEAKRVMSHYQGFIHHASRLYDHCELKVTLGIEPLLCNAEVVAILARFSNKFPLVELKLQQQQSHVLQELLSERQLDLAVGFFTAAQREHFELLASFNVKSAWVAAPEYLKSHSLDNPRIILPSGIDRSQYSDLCQPSQLWSIDDLFTTLQLCRSGVGISCLPQFLIESDCLNSHLVVMSGLLNQLHNHLWRGSVLAAKGSLSEPSDWLRTELAQLNTL